MYQRMNQRRMKKEGQSSIFPLSITMHLHGKLIRTVGFAAVDDSRDAPCDMHFIVFLANLKGNSPNRKAISASYNSFNHESGQIDELVVTIYGNRPPRAC